MNSDPHVATAPAEDRLLVLMTSDCIGGVWNYSVRLAESLEAALAGCALVLSDIPSLREVWSEAALFVPPEDHEALARAVNSLLDDAALRRRYASRARQAAGGYTLRRMAEDYHRTYTLLRG